jgi:hypothetical protein
MQMARISKAGLRLGNALLSPNTQSRVPIQEILNASEALGPPDPAGQPPSQTSDADRKTTVWKDAKLQELQFIGLTVCLYKHPQKFVHIPHLSRN